MNNDLSFFAFRRKHVLKFISVILLQSFTFYNIGSAAAVDGPLSSPRGETMPRGISVEDIYVPNDIGSIEERYKGHGQKLVIQIQDAHCNYDAQANIAGILDHLVKEYGIDLVAVEGADGIVDTGWFNAFPDNDTKREAADYFMKKGEITGAEFLSVTTDRPFVIYGAEDRKHYVKNLNAFLKCYSYRDEFLEYYGKVRKALAGLKRFIYTKELMDLDEKIRQHGEKEIEFAHYLGYLKKVSASKGIDINKYPNLVIFMGTLPLERDINFDLVSEERALAVDELSGKLSKGDLSELVNRVLEFKSGRTGGNEFYSYLGELAEENGISLSQKYENLSKYITYSRLYGRIDNQRLFDETDLLTAALKEKMFADDDQRALDKLWTDVNLILGFMRLEITNKEYEYYLVHKQDFTPDRFTGFISRNSARFGVACPFAEPAPELDRTFSGLMEFYEIGLKRDEIIVKNMFKGMRGKKTDTVVLITGGFHTKGITKILREKKVSYVVISPSITGDAQCPYMAVLTGQETPIDGFFYGSGMRQGQLQVASKFCGLCRDPGIASDHVKESGKRFLEEFAGRLVAAYMSLCPDKPHGTPEERERFLNPIIRKFSQCSKQCPYKNGAEYIVNYLESRINDAEKLDGIFAMVESKTETDTTTDPDSPVNAREITDMILKRLEPVPGKAAQALFRGEHLSHERPAALVEISNILLEAYKVDGAFGPLLVRFYNEVITQAARLDPRDASRARELILIAGQALNIISWVRKGVSGAGDMRLTNIPQRMVESPDKERAPSYLDISTMPVDQAKAEGKPGIYWRGTEGVEKIGGNVSEKAIHDPDRFDAAKNNILMYVMDHGFMEVPEGVRAMTEEGALSTIHETSFLAGFLPGSIQHTSTGPGHFQGTKLDIKYVTGGEGIQYNKFYNEKGELVAVLAQHLKPDSWAVALPGAVDSMENLGGLRFNDISVEVPAKDIGRILKSVGQKLNRKKIMEAAAVIKEASKITPYFAVDMGGRPFLVRNTPSAPDVTWVKDVPFHIFEILSLTKRYPGLTEDRVTEIRKEIVESVSSPKWRSAGKPLETGTVDEITQWIDSYGRLRKTDPAEAEFIPVPAKVQHGAVYEITYATDGFVSGRYKIEWQSSIESDPLTRDMWHCLFVTEGRVRILNERGEPMDEIGPGEKRIMPATAGRYTIKSLEGRATVYTQYKPSDAESLVIAGFRAMNSAANKKRLEEIRNGVRNPIMLHAPDTLHAGDAFMAEKKALRRASGDAVFMRQYSGMDHLAELSGGLGPGYTHVFIMYDDDLERVVGDGALADSLKNVLTRKMISVARPEDETTGIAFAREIESAAVVLGNTEEKEIEEKTGNAVVLRRVMSRLVGAEVTFGALRSLMGTDAAKYDLNLLAARISVLIEELLVSRPTTRRDAEKEIRNRRRVLWSA